MADKVAVLLICALFMCASGLPSSVDWRKEGVLPEVRNQGEVGDSKGIAILEALEASWAIKHRGKITLSLTEYENCCRNISDSCKCIKDIGGLASDEDYPKDSKTCMSEQYKPLAQIVGCVDLPQGNEMALAEELVHQPVVVTVDASETSFELYKSGVYSDRKCSSTKLDHEMLLVGYGTDKDGTEYWLCQNSWGMFTM